MTKPMDILRCEIAPGADLTQDPDSWPWADITHLVETPISVQTGRRDEGAKVAPGDMSVTVVNDSGDLAPPNPLGQWFGDLDIDTPVRLYATGFEDDPVYEGLISELPTAWKVYAERIKQSHAELKATGVLDQLSRGEQPLDSAIFRSVQRADNVVAYWPMEDGSDAESFASPLGGVSPMAFSGDVDLAGQDPPSGSRPLPSFKPGSSFSGPIPAFTLGSGNSWRADWVYRQDESTSTFRTLLGLRMADSANNFIRLRVSSTTFNVQILDDDGAIVVDDDETVHADFFGQWLHVSLLIQNSGQFTYQALVRDATQVLHSVVGSTGTTPPTRPTSVGIGIMATTPESRRVGHVAISSDRLNASFETTALDGYAGEPAATRFSRLCEEEGLRCELIAPDPAPLNDNIGFEVDTSGWGVSFGTLTRSTAQAFEGVASGLLEPSGGNANVDAFIVSSSAMRVRPGGIYQWSVWVLSPDGWHDVRLIITWRDSSLVTTGSVVSDSHVIPAAEWTQLTLTASPSPSDQSDTRFATADVRLADTPTATDVLHIDEAIFATDTSMPMGPQRPLTLTTLLGEVEAAEQAILGERNFGLFLRLLGTLWNQDVALELDASSQLANDLRPMWDTSQRRNDITVSRPNGSSARVDRSTPGRRYPDAVEVNVATDGQLPQIASWLVRLGTIEEYRWPVLPIRVTPGNDQLIPDILAARIGDRATMAHPLPQLPGVDVDVLVEGVQHTIDAIGWDIGLVARPASPFTVAVFDTDRFDTEHSTLAAEFEAGTDTSMSVATAQGPLWTTDAGDLPLLIAASGVVLEVTAISGASSPQTFTITQATVNGVAKTIPAGSQIHLYPRPRFAL